MLSHPHLHSWWRLHFLFTFLIGFIFSHSKQENNWPDVFPCLSLRSCSSPWRNGWGHGLLSASSPDRGGACCLGASTAAQKTSMQRNSQNLSSFIDQVYWVVTGVLMSQGNKRQAVEESSDLASSTSPHPTEKPSTGRSLALKACYGIQAWKHWTVSASDQAENTKVKDGYKPGNSPPLFSS